MKKLFTIILFASVFNTFGATYFIDFVGGNNNNSGGSETSAWKHHPYMMGGDGWDNQILNGPHTNYIHTPGDVFIFKRGVSWPKRSFPIQPPIGGSSRTVIDHYKSVASWGTGDYAIFQGGGGQEVASGSRTELNGTVSTDGGNRFINNEGFTHNIRYQGFKFNGHHWDGFTTFLGQDVIINCSDGITNIQVADCLFTNWTHGTFANGDSPTATKSRGLVCVQGHSNPPFSRDCAVTNCIFDSGTTVNPGGDAIYSIPNAWNCRVHRMVNAFLLSANSTCTGNVVGPIIIPVGESETHDNEAENVGSGFAIIEHNVFTNAGTIYTFFGGYGQNTLRFCNNVYYSVNKAGPEVVPLQIAANFTGSGGASGGFIEILNNTIVAPFNTCIRISSAGTTLNFLNTLVVQNNHFITDVGAVGIDHWFNASGQDQGAVTVLKTTNRFNLQHNIGQAAALGYNAANGYAPLNASFPTIDAGTNHIIDVLDAGSLNGNTRPLGGGWDIGAYEFGSSAVVVNRSYYIDFVGGSDSNNGRSTAAPWKLHPRMAGFAGTYSHTNGDSFVFKGGVTWPNPRLVITNGGDESAFDFYRTTNTWFTGGTFSRPVFDGAFVTNKIIHIDCSTNRAFVWIDSIDVQGFLAPPSAITFNAYGSINMLNARDVFITNCLVHRWTRGARVEDEWMGGICNDPQAYMFIAGSNVVVTGCEIFNSDGDGNCGVGVYGVGEVSFSRIHDISALCDGVGYSFHDNELYNLNTSFLGDTGGGFPSVIKVGAEQFITIGGTNRPIFVYNNFIHDIIRPTGTNSVKLLAVNGFGDFGATPDVYFVNNVTVNCYQRSPLFVDMISMPSGNIRVFAWNNTIGSRNPANPMIGFEVVGTPTRTFAPALIESRNNHFIHDGSALNVDLDNATNTVNMNQFLNLFSTVEAAGYSSNSFYRPLNGSCATVQTGTNLNNIIPNIPGRDAMVRSSTVGGRFLDPVVRSTNWDSGAYQFSDFTNQTLVVTNLAITNIMNTSAHIVWQTSTQATSKVIWGTTVAYGSTNENPSLTVNHDLTMSQLTANTLYHYSFSSVDSFGNSTNSPDATFSTVTAFTDLTRIEAELGVLVAPMETATTGTNTFIWQQGAAGSGTNGQGRASYPFTIVSSNSYKVVAFVNTGDDTNTLNGSHNSFWIDMDTPPDGSTFRTWDITNFTHETFFESRPVSWRGNGTFDSPQFGTNTWNLDVGTHNLYIVARESGTKLDYFAIVATGDTGDQTPPVISDVQTIGIGSRFANIAWITDKLSNSRVDYGLTTSFGTSVSDPSLVASFHVINLEDLTPSTGYFYQVVSTTPNNKSATNGPFSFVTLSEFPGIRKVLGGFKLQGGFKITQ